MTPDFLWQPSPERCESSQMNEFRQLVNNRYNLCLSDYHELYQWSITNISHFWSMAWEYFNIVHSENYYQVVDDSNRMPGARWFQGARLNFAENLMVHRDERTALIWLDEQGHRRELSYQQLYEAVTKLAGVLSSKGISPGDRVVAFMPNLPETVIAMLAVTSLGGIWSSTSPDFGIEGVLSRFQQIKPKLLFTADGTFYGGKFHSLANKLKKIISQMSSLEEVIVTSYINDSQVYNLPKTISWNEYVSAEGVFPGFSQQAFDHPVYIMFSSGTTGLPKSIVHSGGGTLIQHLKELRLHTDLCREDKIFYFTTCGWMMWNWLVSSLAVGATVVLYEGSPFHPHPETLLNVANREQWTIFGTSARYIGALREADVIPQQQGSFHHLRTILSTGSPLPEDSFDFVYKWWKADVQLSSIAGGTDLISCFGLGNPTLPVYSGEIQCRGLGMDVVSIAKNGEELLDVKGELVCKSAFPSMPVYFWNDPDGKKYQNAYFNIWPNTWRHGDTIILSRRGGITMCGRSDATLNPGGVRIGTAEYYAALEQLTYVDDAVVVGQRWEEDERVILFVKLIDGTALNSELEKNIRHHIRKACSPRHIPHKIIQVTDIPYTINGKKVELAVKQVIHGEEVQNRDALANPEALEQFRDIEILKN